MRLAFFCRLSSFRETPGCTQPQIIKRVSLKLYDSNSIQRSNLGEKSYLLDTPGAISTSGRGVIKLPV